MEIVYDNNLYDSFVINQDLVIEEFLNDSDIIKFLRTNIDHPILCTVDKMIGPILKPYEGYDELHNQIKIILNPLESYNSNTKEYIEYCLDFLQLKKLYPKINKNLRSFIYNYLGLKDGCEDLLMEVMSTHNMIEYGCGIGSSWIDEKYSERILSKEKKNKIILWIKTFDNNISIN
jgi:hypothetical protein